MKNSLYIVVISVMLGLTFYGCKKDGDNSINVFSVEDDIAFGKQLDEEIKSNPTDYPIIDSATHRNLYNYVYSVRDKILASGELRFADRFIWKIRIINSETVNAFAAPGGYLYFYTGILKYFDDESQFAGVLAHEMAHADRRHSTDRLTQAYGIELLLSVLLGDDASTMEKIAAEMASGLTTLAYSRKNENEADEFSVKFLYPTTIDSRGSIRFFEKMASGEPSSTPVWLSTHPSDEDRIANMTAIWQGLGGRTGNLYATEYLAFRNLLP